MKMSVAGPLTGLMIRSRVKSLRHLHGVLEKDGIKTRDGFRDMMTAAFAHGGLELRALSDHLGFSFLSVFRWHEGKSAPHPSLWPTVTKWVVENVAERVRNEEDRLAENCASEPSA